MLQDLENTKLFACILLVHLLSCSCPPLVLLAALANPVPVLSVVLAAPVSPICRNYRLFSFAGRRPPATGYFRLPTAGHWPLPPATGR